MSAEEILQRILNLTHRLGNVSTLVEALADEVIDIHDELAAFIDEEFLASDELSL